MCLAWGNVSPEVSHEDIRNNGVGKNMLVNWITLTVQNLLVFFFKNIKWKQNKMGGIQGQFSGFLKLVKGLLV